MDNRGGSQTTLFAERNDTIFRQLILAIIRDFVNHLPQITCLNCHLSFHREAGTLASGFGFPKTTHVEMFCHKGPPIFELSSIRTIGFLGMLLAISNLVLQVAKI
jgi:hypothetical protein